MKLDMSIWPDGDTRRDYTVSANDLHLRSETCFFPNPVAVSMTVQKADDQAVVNGQAHTTGTATCVRCLEEFPVPIDESFRAVVRVVPTAEAIVDTGDDDFYLVPASEPVCDIGDVVRQVIMLALEENPLCKNDCLGLCSGCGRNLNIESCVCAQSQSSGAFASLADLIARSKPKSANN